MDPVTAYLIILLFALLLSALFSGSEIAYISADRLRIELQAKKGNFAGRVLAGFYQKPSRFLGTMLVGNNIALVIFGMFTTRLFEEFLFSQTVPESAVLRFIIVTLCTTLVVLFIGEFIPKILFRLYANQLIAFLAIPLAVIRVILVPVSWIMVKLSQIVINLVMRVPMTSREVVFTRLDLENFIKTSRTDTHEDIDKSLFENALYLTNVRVKDCMIPRKEIQYVDKNASITDLKKVIAESRLSRIIITNGSIDFIEGYIHHQSLFNKPENISSIMMPIQPVPEVMRVHDLLNKFIKDRTNMAYVVDEFGGVSGLITLEDILEEIFGEIEDEYDEEEYIEKQIDEFNYLFSGRLEINYLNEKYPNLNLPEGEYNTLSGYIIRALESIPEQGDAIDLNQIRFTFELVSETKIETLKLTLLDGTEEVVEKTDNTDL